MGDDKLSIIVPVYNGEKTIQNCIKSIQEQSYNNLEIIIINDGSKDRTEELCQKLANDDDRVVVYNQENGGVSSARNKGIQIATGKYTMFVDGDDILDADYFLAFMRQQSMIDNGIIVIARIDTYIGESKEPYTVGNEVQGDLLLEKDHIVDVWNAHLWNSPVNKVYLTEVINNNGIEFDKNVSIGEDWLFNNAYARALKPKGYYIIDDVRYKYYMDSDPWRHCSRDAFYYINKTQVEDFKKTLEQLNVSFAEMWKFDKRDIDFSVTEIRYNVRNHNIKRAKKIYRSEKIPFRVREHRTDFSRSDYLELASGSIFLIYCWENIRKFLGKTRRRL